MAEAVDDAGRPERNPDHLDAPDQHSRPDAEAEDVYQQHDHDADLLARRVDVPFHPVVRRAVAVAFHGFLVARLLHVEEHAAPQHAVDAQLLRAVRIFRPLALGVVLAVDRRPFLGHHAGGQPQPEAEEVAGKRMQVERAVSLVAMQEDGHRGDGDVGHDERDDDVAPPGQVEQAGKHAGETPVGIGVTRFYANRAPRQQKSRATY
jgi:hypothetical protein